MIFDLSKEQATIFNNGVQHTANSVVDDLQSGIIAPGDARAIEARMAAFLAGFKAAPIPPAVPLAFAYGAHACTVFVWQHGPHAEGLSKEACDHFLGAIQAGEPHPPTAFIDFWYCTATDIVTTVCEGQINRASVGDLCEAINSARTFKEFRLLPLDLCIAARLARRGFSN